MVGNGGLATEPIPNGLNRERTRKTKGDRNNELLSRLEALESYSEGGGRKQILAISSG
jgi:hypothetical protein